LDQTFGAGQHKLKLTSYIFKYPKDFILQAIGGVIYNTVIIFGAIFLGKAIDAAGLVYEGKAPVSLFYLNLWLFLGVTLFFQLARYFKRFYMRMLVNKMNCDIRAELLDTLFSLPLNTLSGEKTGDIMSRMIGDVDAVGASVQTTITEMWDTALLMVSYFVACMWYSPKLTLLASIPIPFALFLAEAMRGKLYNLSLHSRKASSAINVHLQHNVTGIMLQRLFGLEQAGRERFELLLKNQYQWQVKFGILQSGVVPFYTLIANIGVVLVLGLGGEFVVSGVWTIGTFTAYLTMFIAMATRTNMAARVMNTWHGAKASWDRICEKMAEKSENLKPTQGAIILDEAGLTVNHLSFTYPFAKEQAVKDVSFAVKNGQIMGITGAVGSGKSALAAALSGLYENERDTRIAYMDSAHFVFSDDVSFNISLGNENTHIEEAIEISELTSDLTRFEKGLQTRLMERGVRVSGGQRQRIALARAWATDCRVLILDDPFSAIDITMEQKIMQNLRKNLGDKIILLFSHRLTTFTHTDQILLLQNGTIAEMGTHNELFALNGTYKSIYSAQVFLGGGENEK
jgi:ABC-type multidrug transport system fused ATPase/permease subunit